MGGKRGLPVWPQDFRIIFGQLKNGFRIQPDRVCQLRTPPKFARYQEAYAFGRIGLQISERLADNRYQGFTHYLLGAFVNRWGESYSNSIDHLKKASRYISDCGERRFYSSSLLTYVSYLDIAGETLDRLFESAHYYFEFSTKLKFVDSLPYYITCQHKVLSLRGATVELASFSTDTFDEGVFEAELSQQINKIPLTWYCYSKVHVAYLLQRYDIALQFADQFTALIQNSHCTVSVPLHYFYHSLVLLALYPDAPPLTKIRYRWVIACNQRKLKRLADSCAANYSGLYQLVEAERTKLAGRDSEAMQLYSQAITSAQANGFIQNAALANELAANFYLSRGVDEVARTFLLKAWQNYRQWGATAKLQALETIHPWLAAGMLKRRRSDEGVDINTVIKASQAISQTIDLNSLLKKLMQLLLENAGAQKGILLLKMQEELQIYAQANTETIRILQAIPVHDSNELSHALINLVNHTHETLVLADASSDTRFKHDSYVIANLAKSIICIPLLKQAELLGIIYLENNLASGVFTQKRCELLNILSTQIAISLENATLYHSMEQKISERTELLAKANRQLEKLSYSDGLTGIANRRRFEELWQLEWQRALSQPTWLSVGLIDVDHFKLYNDRYGHQAGDDCLRAVAQALADALQRASDTVARYGGEEFVVILPDQDFRQASKTMEHLHLAVATLNLPHTGNSVASRVTISSGLAYCTPRHNMNPLTLIELADQSLYAAKRNGRNRVGEPFYYR